MITMNMFTGANFVQINQPVQYYGGNVNNNVGPYNNMYAPGHGQMVNTPEKRAKKNQIVKQVGGN